jgi:hypothetical protein
MAKNRPRLRPKCLLAIVGCPILLPRGSREEDFDTLSGLKKEAPQPLTGVAQLSPDSMDELQCSIVSFENVSVRPAVPLELLDIVPLGLLKYAKDRFIDSFFQRELERRAATFSANGAIRKEQLFRSFLNHRQGEKREGGTCITQSLNTVKFHPLKFHPPCQYGSLLFRNIDPTLGEESTHKATVKRPSKHPLDQVELYQQVEEVSGRFS